MFTLKSKTIFGLLLLAVLSLTLLLFGASATAAPPDDGLFVDVARTPTVSQISKPTVLRTRYVDVKLNLLDGAAAPAKSRLAVSAGKTITLNLFADVKFTAVQDRARVSPQGLVWTGHLDGVKNSAVTLIVRNSTLVGNIRTPKAYYQVRYVGNRVHAIYQVNEKTFPPDRKPLKVDKTKLPKAVTAKTADNGLTIDVMVVYTPAAQNAAGGSDAMNALIQLAIEESNQAFRDTPINPISTSTENLRLNLVRAELVSYTESGDLDTDLARLQNPTDGFMDNVPPLRDKYGADVVTLVAEGMQYCGVAFDIMNPVSGDFAPYAYDLVTRDCMAGNYTFPHELGHLMSARHDWDEDSTDNAPFTYNHGYIAPDKTFRTIMAYYNSSCEPNGCPRVGIFSNPDNSNFGVPAGVPEGSFHAADNRKTLNNTAYTVANFRQSQPIIPPGPVILNSPSGNICTRQPTFNWTVATNATWYDLWVEGTTGSVFKQWYEAAQVCSGSTCSATPALTLAIGNHTWSVLPWNSSGAGSWSSKDFVVGGPPDAPTAISPSGAITTNTPTLKWYALSNADKYDLRVKNEYTQQEIAKEVNAANVCSGSTCAWTVESALSAADYIGSARASGTCGGYGQWNAGMRFSLDAPPLDKPTPLSPSGEIADTTPTLTWTVVSGATSYGLEVTLETTTQSARTRLAEQRLDAAQYCNGSTCSYTLTTPLSPAGYYWRVQARDSRPSEKWSAWSDKMYFTVVSAVCQIVSLDAPTGTISDSTPTYQWTFSGDCTMFYPWVIKKPSSYVYPATWLNRSDVCSGSSCSWTPTQVLPGSGDYSWAMMGYPGYAWLGPIDFTLSTGNNGFASPPWDGWEYHYGTWYEIGAYPSTWLFTEGVAWLWASTSHVGDYTTLDYEVTMWRNGCEWCSNSLTVRGVPTPVTDGDWYSAYQFQYSRKGYFSVWKGVNGYWSPMQYWVYTSAIKPGNNWNTLRVLASGPNLYYYINGILVWVGYDTALPSGRVGVVMSRTDGTSSGNGLYISSARLTVPALSAKSLPNLSAAQQAANEAANRAKVGTMSAGPK
jgi:hypothetical protein